MENIKEHFKSNDPKLFACVEGNGWYKIRRPHSRFMGLCRIIAGQQLSTKSARSIFSRFCCLFQNGIPNPKETLRLNKGRLRRTGLSESKCQTILTLARAIESGSLSLRALKKECAKEVMDKLTEIKGIGPWSAEMFLMFYLGHEDIFSSGDLGLRSAITKLEGKKSLVTEKEAEKRAKRWKPYRTYAARILWNSLDNTP